MKNQEIALKAYAYATVEGHQYPHRNTWQVWQKSLGREVPADYYDCYHAYMEDEEWGVDWNNLLEQPSVKEYLAPYLAIQTLEAGAKVFREYVDSNDVTIAHLKAGLLAQLTQGEN